MWTFVPGARTIADKTCATNDTKAGQLLVVARHSELQRYPGQANQSVEAAADILVFDDLQLGHRVADVILMDAAGSTSQDQVEEEEGDCMVTQADIRAILNNCAEITRSARKSNIHAFTSTWKELMVQGTIIENSSDEETLENSAATLKRLPVGTKILNLTVPCCDTDGGTGGRKHLPECVIDAVLLKGYSVRVVATARTYTVASFLLVEKAYERGRQTLSALLPAPADTSSLIKLQEGLLAPQAIALIKEMEGSRECEGEHMVRFRDIRCVCRAAGLDISRLSDMDDVSRNMAAHVYAGQLYKLVLTKRAPKDGWPTNPFFRGDAIKRAMLRSVTSATPLADQLPIYGVNPAVRSLGFPTAIGRYHHHSRAPRLHQKHGQSGHSATGDISQFADQP